MSASPRYIVIGNTENRRVTMFVDELARAGAPKPVVLSHHELLTQDLEPLRDIPDEPHVVRFDSCGESFDVEKALLRAGYEDAAEYGASTLEPSEVDALEFDLGKILCPRQHHFGFERYVRRVAEVYAERPSWRVLAQPDAILQMFDKRETSALYEEHGIPVPEPVRGIESADMLRARLEDLGISSVFVKVSCSSSASCLAIYSRRADREQITTTIEMTPGGWYNSLRLRRYTSREDVDTILSFLISEGAQIEQAVSKARLDGAFFDTRVVVIDGEPAFTVVRQNRHPITNLHLGGWRGDLEALRAAVPEEMARAVDETCRAVAARHAVFAFGLDILYEAGFRSHRVLESNAFGDLLPNLERDGLSVYGWQIRHAPTDR